MARDNPMTVRFSDQEEAFLNNMANKDCRKPAALMYMIAIEYMKEHGFSEKSNDKTSIVNDLKL
jgi:hypothetical protein